MKPEELAMVKEICETAHMRYCQEIQDMAETLAKPMHEAWLEGALAGIKGERRVRLEKLAAQLEDKSTTTDW